MTDRAVAPSHLRLNDLHGSLDDPLLDTMNFLNEVTARFPDAISFGPGRPHEEPFDVDMIASYLRAYTEHLSEHRGLSDRQISSLLFQYGRTNGQIHDLIATTVRNDEGLAVSAESVVVTVGAQEGIVLVLRALVRHPTDVILVSSPCYIGITGAARLLDIAVEPVPEAPAGSAPQRLREIAGRLRAAGRRPRALYVVPDFANPSGARMSLADRHRLLAAAAAEDLLILEDNPYGLFSSDGVSLPTLKCLDQDRRVIYLGSFAKSCFPGARVGYVIADQEVVAPDGSRSLLANELSKLKSMTTVNTSSVTQAVIGGMLLLNGCRLRTANHNRIAIYQAKLDATLAALDRYFPPVRRARLGIRWTTPEGGFFLPMRVPFAADDAALTRSARDHRVLWTPMRYFYLDDSGGDQIRLSFSYLDIPEIEEGVRRLSDFVDAETAAITAARPAGPRQDRRRPTDETTTTRPGR